MESSQFPSVSYWLKHVEEDEEPKGEVEIPQPETPNEPMEFLSRSWTLSANQISKALAAANQPPAFDNDNHFSVINAQTHLSGKVLKPLNERLRAAANIGRLFHHNNESNDNTKKKDKARIENAHMHALISVAGLAAALASASASTEESKKGCSKMSTAMGSATQLLASYCIELAESAGTDPIQLSSVVRSAIGIRTSSDLLTFTAAAATALRGEAALKTRLPKEARRSASISPYEKVIADSHSLQAFQSIEIEEEDIPFEGDLLQLTQKGVLRWRHVSVYTNKACQVTIKLKSKHVGGAFSKNNKCTVYEVIDESGGWPFKKERENMEVYFGVKTAQGLMEFKCKNKVHKQRWVYGIQKLLQRISRFEEADNSLRMLNINKTI